MKNGWLVFVIFTFAPSAFTAELPKEGTYDYTSCWTSVRNDINFSKTHTAGSFDLTGTIRSNVPNGAFDKDSFRCVGVTGSIAGKTIGTSVCESVDADGDKRLTYFSVGNDGKTIRETVAGTGKYEGLVTTGTVQPLGPFPPIKAGMVQDCNRQSGTYKLK
jgi:hypothetical protein